MHGHKKRQTASAPYTIKPGDVRRRFATRTNSPHNGNMPGPRPTERFRKKEQQSSTRITMLGASVEIPGAQ